MLESVLTPDIHQLKGVTKDPETQAQSAQIAVNCMHNTLYTEIGTDVRDLLEHSTSENTKVAYRTDLKHFSEWGGILPASPETVARYIANYAGKLAVSTITRRVATLSKAHETMDAPNPCRSELVRAALKGLRRKHGTANKQAKALLKEDLFAILDNLGDGPKDTRDRALLLVGFAGGFRRRELVGLNVADIEFVRQGMIITLTKSKTDQEGHGRKIGIPHGRTQHCPVEALKTWFKSSEIAEGPIFRPINRHGQMRATRLSGDAVSEVICTRAAEAGLDPSGYSGHSLRAGFATSATQAGASTLKIRQQTGHASDAMLQRYVRDGELFVGNAAGFLL